MLRSLNSAVSGLENFQEEMDVIGNNIANINTTGFKSGRSNFAESFSDTLSAASGSSGTGQVGLGVTTTSVSNDYTQGALNTTGVHTDLAIQGDGFFMVRDTADNAQYATRAGNFSLDANGYLLTDTHERVQGYSDAGLSTRGDIKIDTTGMPATSSSTAGIQSYSIGGDGKITVNLDDGTSFVRGQVLLQNFQNPQALVKAGANLYSGLGAAGPLSGSVSASAAPGTSGLGNIKSGSLEMSNVDLSNEMAQLITAQRAFEANAKIITTSDELMQDVNNLKH